MQKNTSESDTLDIPTSALPPPTCSTSHIHSLTNLSGSPASQPVTSPLSESASTESFHSDIGSLQSTSNLAQNSTSDTKNLGVQNSNESQANACLLLAKDIKVEVNEESTQPEEQKKVPYNILENIKQPVESYEMPIHPIVKILLDCEPPVRMSNHVATEDETEESLMTSFVKLADTELVDVITWAKNVPGIFSKV